ncbi:hypothetical protein ACQQ2N_00360 [Dokdonella sp. MW10]|uniref:hypothetical protein n=1 Tax=Dokdonella sp. MW10 TaxID=2992926 RepID=UPI003F7FF336
MLDSELQTAGAAGAHAPVLDTDALLRHLAEALPRRGGRWRIASLKAELPASGHRLAKATSEPSAPKKDEDKEQDPAPTPDSAPIRPGAPKIEVVYEWQEA